MSFRRFIYYCAVCGGWAAFLAWALVLAGNVRAVERPVLKTTLIAAVLGLLLVAAVGAVDALQRRLRNLGPDEGPGEPCQRKGCCVPKLFHALGAKLDSV